MKKMLALALIMVFVIGLVGCSQKLFVENSPADDTQPSQTNEETVENVSEKDSSLSEGTIAAIVSDGDEIPVYIELYHDETENLLVPFNERLDDVKDQIPVITYREGMSVEVSEQYECWGIGVYDIFGEYVKGLVDLSALSRVNGGEYYFSAYVVEKRANETREYNGYNCVFRMAIPDLDPFLTVISGGVETVAPKYWYCGMFWNESEYGSGWLFGDDAGIYENWEETFGKLPEVRMNEDFSLRRGENAVLQSGCVVFDEQFERIWLENHEELNSLESGTYYIVMSVFRHGTETHEGETGYDGYNCGFKLIVP